MGFTGHYNRCTICGHIYDFNDICPECSCDFIQDLNPSEVKYLLTISSKEEVKRIEKMLKLHGDF